MFSAGGKDNVEKNISAILKTLGLRKSYSAESTG